MPIHVPARANAFPQVAVAPPAAEQAQQRGGGAYPGRMITGGHVIIYSRDAEADRAFFRDVLEYPHVDAGVAG